MNEKSIGEASLTIPKRPNNKNYDRAYDGSRRKDKTDARSYQKKGLRDNYFVKHI